MRTSRLLALGFAASSLLSCGEPVSPGDELGPGLKQSAPALALSPTAVKYTVAVTDPINDRFGADFLIDVSRMDLTFDSGTGDYEIVVRTHPGFPFSGVFRININLFNVDAGSFFSDAVNDFDLTSPTDSILLTGSAVELTTWQSGDQVYTNSLAGTPNPPGATLFRSAVGSIDGGFLTAEDVIAFADLSEPALVALVGLTPAQRVSHMLGEIEELVASGALARSRANGLLAKLTAVQAKIEGGQLGAASNQLKAFTNQVEAFSRTGVLSQSDAQRLLDEAMSVASQLAVEAPERGPQ
jgi:hypothetical protein